MHDAHIQFIEAIRKAGLPPPDVIKADGRIHRFSSNGKRGDTAGWYILHEDGIPAGAFGDWRTGIGQKKWRADIGRSLTAVESAAYRARLEAIKNERQAEEARYMAEAKARAARIWQSAQPAPDDHRYLIDKRIKASGARLHEDALLIPVQAGDELCSLQFISPDGKKRFLRGGQIEGGYFFLGEPSGADILCIAEGFATGASIHEVTGYPVAVAFNAGNLEPLARAMRYKFPGLSLILCADDDYRTEGNPGLTKAHKAAQSVGGLVAVPDFGAGRPDGATDFNDMYQLCGVDAVIRAIARASVPAGYAPLSEVENPPSGNKQAIELRRGSDLKPEPVTWLWPGWLAIGKMHILGGAPGTGKTTISMAIAAIVTIGGCWPDGSESPLGSVLIWSGEDDPADTLIPRLILSGADLSRVYFITSVKEGNEQRSFDPARDMEALQGALAGIGDVRLLIVDPIVSAVSGDSHKNAEVRRGLQPLVDLAASIQCALLGITHFSKGTGGRDPVERLNGSLAFGAVARVVMVAAKRQETGKHGCTMRLLVRAKSNIGPDDGGFEYDLHQGELELHPGVLASSVRWGDELEGTARELLASADTLSEDGEGGLLADAMRFLRDLLADGPVSVRVIKEEAVSAGISWMTVRRAHEELDIKSSKTGMKGGWEWRLPQRCSTEHEDAQQKKVSIFGTFEHLRDETGLAKVEVSTRQAS